MSQSRPVAPLSTILRAKIRQPQFYWFLGHLLTLYHFVRYSVSFSARSIGHHYSRALLFITITYGIVLYQFYKSGQLTIANARQQLRTLDNLQYFTVALVLYVCANAHVVKGALTAPAIFSLFHSLNYFKDNLLPFLPFSPVLKTAAADRVTFFITQYNEKFLMVAQNIEIVTAFPCMLMLPLTYIKLLVRFSGAQVLHALSVGAYLSFFKLRYTQNPQMRQLLHAQYVGPADAMVQARFPQLMHRWQSVKHLVGLVFGLIPI
ncbi:LAFE_0B01046g1_1 [Lachancea fermentati]|uniref:LAFE_0B01046g1_1 n=1 Tax=Lachancea fermentati TaxID=4955 RepID=A0A1G4M7A4_LACFM|nr:LAFE_0B01046g1_1 [Lachancea fermentati]